MVICVTGNKGGVGKTTSAIHVARWMQELCPGDTLLVDGDQNRSAFNWRNKRSEDLGDFPVEVLPENRAWKARRFEHLVIDTKGRPSREDMIELADGSDLMILPTTPDSMAVEQLLRTVDFLGGLDARFRVLLTRVPPVTTQPEAKELLKLLKRQGVPLFRTYISNRKAFQWAALEGKVVGEMGGPGSRIASRAYRDVVREVIEVVEKEAEK